MEPSFRDENYEEKLEKEWLADYGDDWDLIHYDYWIKQSKLFTAAVQQLALENKFTQGGITV